MDAQHHEGKKVENNPFGTIDVVGMTVSRMSTTVMLPVKKKKKISLNCTQTVNLYKRKSMGALPALCWVLGTVCICCLFGVVHGNPLKRMAQSRSSCGDPLQHPGRHTGLAHCLKKHTEPQHDDDTLSQASDETPLSPSLGESFVHTSLPCWDAWVPLCPPYSANQSLFLEGKQWL